jgi:hypothetical protein
VSSSAAAARRWTRPAPPAQRRRVRDRPVPARPAEMPAQARRSRRSRARGHLDPDRDGRDRGRRPGRARRRGSARWPGAAGRVVDRRSDWAPVPGTDSLPARHVLVAIGEEPDPSILPEGAGIEVSASGPASSPTHGPWPRAGPASSPAATSCPAPRRSSTRSPPAAGRPARSTSTWPGVGTARPRSWPRSATRPRPRAGSGSTLRLARERQPGAPDRPNPLVRGNPGGLPEAVAIAEASRCFRCDASDQLPNRRSAAPAAGRPIDQRPGPRPCNQEELDDPGSGLRPVRRRRILRRGHDRRGARRPLAAGRGALSRPPVHGRQRRQVLAPPRGRPVVDHLRRPARHPARPGLPGQLHLLLPGRRGRARPADHRRPRGRVRLLGPADQADDQGRRGPALVPHPGPAARAGGDPLHRALPPGRAGHPDRQRHDEPARGLLRELAEPRLWHCPCATCRGPSSGSSPWWPSSTTCARVAPDRAGRNPKCQVPRH